MTHEEMLQQLAPARLPTGMAWLSLPELLALLGLGLAAGVLAAALILPFTRSRAPRNRLRLSQLRALPVPQRMLALARHLGHLPPPLHDAAYGAATPPSDERIERIARRARLTRLVRGLRR
ncbi:hypothetical protein [Paracoccus sp. T5]|uniref:hypothetical protein n=1 Tax=Paracoccus sp. T5 TaxID=3402161 RepID=UPI003ADC3AEE